MNQVRERTGLRGPHRGFAAGSLVAYALNITGIDPILHRLLFETVINSDFIKQPNFGIDITIANQENLIRILQHQWEKNTISENTLWGYGKKDNSPIKLEPIPLNDTKTLDHIQRCSSLESAKIESKITHKTIRLVNPEHVDHLTAAIALDKINSLQENLVTEYLERRHGRKATTVIHYLLDDILAETYGLFIYQEQVMLSVSRLSGFSQGAAENFCYSVQQKNQKSIHSDFHFFLDDCYDNGIDNKIAHKLFLRLREAAATTTPKSEVLGYALDIYQRAFLHVHSTEMSHRTSSA